MSPIVRRTDLTLGAFSDHWRTTHRELALRLVAPGIMRGYVQNHRLPVDLEGIDCAGDGCPELWVDSIEAVSRLGTCPEYLDGARLDEPNFMSGDALLIIARPTILIDAVSRRDAAAATKLLLFLRRSPHAPPTRLAEIQDVAYPLLLPGVRPLRLEREIAVHDLPDGLPAPAYDVIETSWWPDLATLGRAWMHRNVQAPIAGLDTSRLAGMLAWELPVLWPATD